MLFNGEFVAGVDLVDVMLWLFTLFFLGLVLYLQREGMREGYPLEDDSGRVDRSAPFVGPSRKIFRLPHDRGDIDATEGRRDTRDLALKQIGRGHGLPFAPTGDPMADGVGAASYAERHDVPDLTDDGRDRIVPFRLGDGFYVPKEDPNPVGMTVYGADNKPGGEVVDIWVDRSEAIIRYLEVRTGEGETARNVLLPMPFAKVSRGRKRRVDVEALLSGQFAGVPGTKSPDSVTRLEEDKISGYYGGGKFYATRQRSEPWL